ncbi:MAG: DUF5131 family protein [Methanobacterium sp.]|nr:DUF5131 family protein [Methanobacterium sp.]
MRAAVWNPVRGCRPASDGCLHCWAAAVANMRQHNPLIGARYQGLTTKTADGRPVFNGTTRLTDDDLDLPLRTKKPTVYFVCSEADLFGESVRDEWIDRVFAVMALCPQHLFILLTKRARRMRAYMTDDGGFGRWGYIENRAKHIARQVLLMRMGDLAGKTLAHYGQSNLPNVWMGVSVENQATADERIPELLATPAALRWVSAEPLLGEVDLRRVHWRDGDDDIYFDALAGGHWMIDSLGKEMSVDGPVWGRLDWVIAGGESGLGARPTPTDWARTLRDQGAAAGVPFFFKQWGEWTPTGSVDTYSHGPKHERAYPTAEGVLLFRDGRTYMRDFSVKEHGERQRRGIAVNTAAVIVDKSADRDFRRMIADEKRIEDDPLGTQWMYRVGKKAAGHLLDGREHREVPR